VEQWQADGGKAPLRPKHVWSIRTKLQIEGSTRDLAMFNLAIDSKLRGCDVVAIRVEDIAAGGYTADRATVRQKKTARPVRFELSEQTRQAIDDYLKAANKRPGEFLQELRKAFLPIRKVRAISQKLYSHPQPPNPHSV
jgi:integrase